MNELKVAASSLRARDAADCGRDTAARAVAALEGGPADALVVFSSPRTDLAALNAGVRAAAPSALLVGCTTAGEIGPHGRGQEGVVVGALRFPGHRLHAAVVHEVSRDTRRGGARLAANAVGGAQPVRGTLMLFADGLSCDGMALIDGLYDGPGPGVQVIGGFAGDDWQFQRTAQFCGGEVFYDAAVALFLDGVELGLSAKHGFRATGEPRLATRVDGKRLLEVDDEPAIRTYLDFFGLPRDTTDLALLEQRGLTPGSFPLGIPKLDTEYMVRCFLHVEPDGAVIFNSRIPEHAIVRIMTGTRESLLEASRAAAVEARQMLAGRALAGALVVNCCSRERCLGSDVATEVANIQAELGADVPMLGFYSYGEFGRYANTAGPPMLLNQTCIVGAFAR